MKNESKNAVCARFGICNLRAEFPFPRRFAESGTTVGDPGELTRRASRRYSVKVEEKLNELDLGPG